MALPRPAVPSLRQVRWLRPLLLVVAFGMVAAWPWALNLPLAIVGDAIRASQYALIAVSLVLLTGWVGQISLAQGSFVGVGAFVTALVFRDTGVGFPYSLPIAVAASSLVAIGLGVVALRVRGLYLAVATLIFAWMADQFLFSATWFVGAGGSASIKTDTIGQPHGFPSFDLHDPKVFYVIAVAGLALGMLIASNLRDSKTGRAFYAIRGSEVAAASLGMDVTRYKLLAFGLSGGLAGLAGHLQMVGQGSVVPSDFDFLTSLFYLSIVVVGGLSSLPGAVAAGILFSALYEVFYRVSALNGFIQLTSGLLLLGVLLAYPGGIAAAGSRLGRRIANLASSLAERPRELPETGEVVSLRDSEAAHRREEHEAEQISLLDLAEAHTKPLPLTREERTPVLEAEGIRVQFGGLVAVDDVSLSVREGEIVGLIGPNGAGKTTLFNAVAGLNQPTAGTVRMFGKDVTALPVHARAAMGVGRTFQLIQLFPQLNVFDNLLAATHLQNHTRWIEHVVVTERALAEERAARARVNQVIEQLDLGDVAYRTVSGLPFGVLRTVELARALVTGAPLVMLDEPASGLDNAETDRLARLLMSLRRDMGITLLLIEHDVPMVTRVCDYIYVINRGRPLAEGTAEEIQQNPDVIAAYLGRPAVAEATA
jgi:ABC-type branched-subunit amino acid transport system ATPase component/ABC-type branched-subunit amino acid transport system permease subunit